MITKDLKMSILHFNHTLQELEIVSTYTIDKQISCYDVSWGARMVSNSKKLLTWLTIRVYRLCLSFSERTTSSQSTLNRKRLDLIREASHVTAIATQRSLTSPSLKSNHRVLKHSKGSKWSQATVNRAAILWSFMRSLQIHTEINCWNRMLLTPLTTWSFMSWLWKTKETTRFQLHSLTTCGQSYWKISSSTMMGILCSIALPTQRSIVSSSSLMREEYPFLLSME